MHLYTPFIFLKQGEYKALGKLDDPLKHNIIPLFDLPALTFNHEGGYKPDSLISEQQKWVKYIEKHWHENLFYLDTNEISDEEKVINEFFLGLDEAKVLENSIPVVRLNSPDTYINTLKSLCKKNSLKTIALRLSFLEDSGDESFNQMVTNLLASMESLGYEKFDLIYDLGSPEGFDEYEDLAGLVYVQLTSFDAFEKFDKVIIGGSSFPEHMGKISTPMAEIPRYEWKHYHSLKGILDSEEQKKIIFGDYGIDSPGLFEFDPVRMTSSASIKYTIDNSWIIYKGKSLKKNGYTQFNSLASLLKQSDYYMGEEYSDGDKTIAYYAANPVKKGKVETGNQSTWREVAYNHHFTKVLNDLKANHDDF